MDFDVLGTKIFVLMSTFQKKKLVKRVKIDKNSIFGIFFTFSRTKEHAFFFGCTDFDAV